MQLLVQNSEKNNLLFIIAAVSMVIDHIGAAFFPQVHIFRILGRIAFPIFAYGVAQGVKYTSDIKKYIARMLIAGIVAQPFYMYCIINKPNIMFELALYALALYMIKKRRILYAFLLAAAAAVLNFDYGIYGLGMALAFFFMETDKTAAIIFMCAISIIMGLSSPYFVQAYAIAAIPVILFVPYKKIKLPRYFFYFFYPLHLMVLSAIKILF